MIKHQLASMLLALAAVTLVGCDGTSDGSGDAPGPGTDMPGNGGDDGGTNGGGGDTGGPGDDGDTNGGDGSGDSTEAMRDSAARASAGGALIAASAPALVSTGTGGGDDEKAMATSTSTKDAQPCGNGGTLDQFSSSEDVGSPYFNGAMPVDVIIADNCRESQSGQGFSFSSRMDGRLTVGSAEDGAVTYVRASDLGNDPDVGDPYIATVMSSGASNSDTSFNFRGLMHICERCASPQEGGTTELTGYFEGGFSINGNSFEIGFGESTAAPLNVVVTENASTTETAINGRLAFDDGEQCAFDADYTTISPIVTMTGDDGLPNSGELDVAVEGANPIRIVFIGDGSATIDGQTYTAEQLSALADECTPPQAEQ